MQNYNSCFASLKDQETNVSGGEEGANSDSSLERRLVATEKRKPSNTNGPKFHQGWYNMKFWS